MTFRRLIEAGYTRIRRPDWNPQAYLKVSYFTDHKGHRQFRYWLTLYDRQSQEAGQVRVGGQKVPYTDAGGDDWLPYEGAPDPAEPSA